MNTNHFDSQAGLPPERGGTIIGFVTIIGFFMVGGLFGVTSDARPLIISLTMFPILGVVSTASFPPCNKPGALGMGADRNADCNGSSGIAGVQCHLEQPDGDCRPVFVWCDGTGMITFNYLPHP